MTLPQIGEVWVHRRTEGLSLATWSLYTVAAFVWLAYGAQIRDRPLVVSSLLWIVMEGSVVAGLVLV